MKTFKYNISEFAYQQLSYSRSQAGQDLLVIALTEGKLNGSFLEIGAGHPEVSSNTFLLEKRFNYTGISIEQHYEYELPLYFEHFKNQEIPLWKDLRPNSTFIINDARKINYKDLGAYFDYLSFDLDTPQASWEVLIKIIPDLEFAVITFEHDVWTNSIQSKILKNKAFNHLSQHGYKLLVDNVTIEPGKGSGINGKPIYFEDWYVNPKYISASVIDSYKWVTLDLTTKYYPDILFS